MTLSKIISICCVHHHWNGFLRHHSYLLMNGSLLTKMFQMNSGYRYYFLKEKKSYYCVENSHYNYYTCRGLFSPFSILIPKRSVL